jgi:tRNA CCA-adding enzyme
MKKIDLILEEVIKRVEPSEEEIKYINKFLKEFIEKIKSQIKKQKIKADVFVGGSFAKGTLIKKDKYDIDIFLRFDKQYPNNELSDLTKKLLKEIKSFSIVHGSRDYFSIKARDNFIIELVPVRRISNPKEAENITDLSYLHVRYINKKIKSKKILKDIKIAKAFCYASNCYGAESYIKGFSGYSLELMVHNYKGFLNFIKAVSKMNPDERNIIDSEKLYKNKKQVLLDMNTSKLISPIILVDPTYKQRNALAALSKETFIKFQKHCIKFLKSPSIKMFENEKKDLNKLKENAVKNKKEFLLLEINTDKQEGDVAGSKLYKFYNHLSSELNRFFMIKNKGFNYNNKQNARCFFILKNREFVLFNGPFVSDKKNVAKFKKQHKNIFVKNKRLFAKEKINFSGREFLNKWKFKHKNKIHEMSILSINLLNLH